MTLRRKKVFLITTGVTILVVVAIILALLINLQAFKPRIEGAASNALGMEVRIKGRLGIALVPVFGISLKGVSVGSRGADVVTIEKMRIGLELLPLMRREVRISRVDLIKPVFSLVRYKNGRFNFEKPRRTPSERYLTVTASSLSEGNLVFTDERSGQMIEVRDFDRPCRTFPTAGRRTRNHS